MPERRKLPAPPQSRQPSNTTNATEFTALLGLQRHEPLTAEDRADLDVLVAAAERGFRLATQCVDCGHWLAAPRSVRRHRGPRCAARAAGA